MKFLRKTYVLLAFFSMLLLVFCYCTPFINKDDGTDPEIVKNVRRILSYLHYSPQSVDNTFSEAVYDRYMENLDNYKSYFKKKDIEEFNKYRDLLDDYYKDENTSFYNRTIDTLYNRVDELSELTPKLLEKPFDFNKKETLELEYDSVEYAATQTAWENRWKKRLKYNVLQEVLILEQSAKDSAYWAKQDSIGIDEDTFDPRGKTFDQLEKEARKSVKENMESYFNRFKKRKKQEWFSLYVNALTEQYDPHTNYFSPKENEDFEVTMSGQLEGIGATLTEKKGFPSIVSLVVGGPAWKQGDLEVEDQITKVAQEGKEPVNVQGMLLDDAIRLIRGKKGTVVTLTVKKKDGSFKQIPIKRDIVEIEETFARSAVVTDDKGDKYGVIYLPSFYLNYDGKGHDASDDVKEQIEELKKEEIKGLVFDLRNNGGGDLSECVEIVGHFIPKGPVVQVVRSDGDKKEYTDDDGGEVEWQGPMVVMVNELSASASEIMAAALQDYKRAVILGSPKTYGKGTVQIVRPLSTFLNSNEEYGALKFTIQKFYRINGGSTQLKGVESNVVMPDRYTYLDISEGAQKTALPWDQIEELDYNLWENPVDYAAISTKSKERLNNSEQVKKLSDYAHWVKKMETDSKKIDLKYSEFKNHFERIEKESDEYDKLKDYRNGLELSSPTYEEKLMKKDTVLRERRKKWHEDLGKDIYLKESIEVMQDLK